MHAKLFPPQAKLFLAYATLEIVHAKLSSARVTLDTRCLTEPAVLPKSPVWHAVLAVVRSDVRRPLVRTGVRVGVPAAEVVELLQETALQLWMRPDGWVPVNAAAYYITVVRQQITRVLRAYQIHERRGPLFYDDKRVFDVVTAGAARVWSAPPADAQDAVAHERALDEVVAWALHAMVPRVRETMCHWLNDRTLAETATAMGAAMNTVRVWRGQGKPVLHAALLAAGYAVPVHEPANPDGAASSPISPMPRRGRGRPRKHLPSIGQTDQNGGQND